MIDAIIKQLKATATPFKKIVSFSDEPGIYALFFYGSSFPLESYQPKKNEIIYIGKTESSQQSRDADTHFRTGKTGSSTLRKTFGSLLHQQYKLNPLPRGQADIDKNRYAHFKFDTKSEELLTKWMTENLGLSFFPYPKTTSEIDNLETLLINELVPVLNIDRKNTGNPFFHHLRSLRKQMGEVAYSMHKKIKPIVIIPPPKALPSKQKILFILPKVYKYEDIWKKVAPSILQAIKNDRPLFVELSKNIFDKAGNRKSYAFALEFMNGRVCNNISGSAVARDLARVLEDNTQFKILAQNKHIKLKMGKDFIMELK
jgi:hypothetical protein